MASAHLVHQVEGEFRVLSATEAAYLAGLIDGEGTISIYARQKGKNLSHVLNEHVSLVNTNLAIVDYAARIIGSGTIYERDRGLGNRICYTLPFDGQRAVWVAGQIKPYLIGKREQAEIVLSLAALRDSCRTANWVDYSDEHLAEMSRMVNRIGALNGSHREPIQIEQVRTTRRMPGAPPQPCSVDECSERVKKGCGGMCLTHYREVQTLVHTHRCEWCGNNYKAERVDQKFCSSECQWRAGRLRREGKGEPRRFPCPQCGAEVVTTDPRKQTCSTACGSRRKYEERKLNGYFEARKAKKAAQTE